jgi:hypothetical protein
MVARVIHNKWIRYVFIGLLISLMFTAYHIITVEGEAAPVSVPAPGFAPSCGLLPQPVKAMEAARTKLAET